MTTDQGARSGAPLAGIALGLWAAMGDAAAANNPLAAYAWTARPLVIFGAGAEAANGALDAQIAAFQARRADLIDRDMPLIVVRAGVVAVDGAPSDIAADALRVHAGAPTGAVTVALFGKDAGLKFREPAPVSPDAVFDLIDVMPMRRREMSAQ